MKKRLFLGDILILFLILFSCSILGYFLYLPQESTSAYVVITYDGTEFGEFSLGTDKDIPISDSGMVLTISDGKAYISLSDCPDGVCMKQGKLSMESPNGKSLICLPNRVTVRLKNSSPIENEVDAVVG